MTTGKYTHKGWIGLCPIYIHDKDSSCPDVEPRYPMTGWLLSLSLWLFDLFGAMNSNDDGSIPIRITGKLKP